MLSTKCKDILVLTFTSQIKYHNFVQSGMNRCWVLRDRPRRMECAWRVLGEGSLWTENWKIVFLGRVLSLFPGRQPTFVVGILYRFFNRFLIVFFCRFFPTETRLFVVGFSVAQKKDTGKPAQSFFGRFVYSPQWQKTDRNRRTFWMKNRRTDRAILCCRFFSLLPREIETEKPTWSCLCAVLFFGPNQQTKPTETDEYFRWEPKTDRAIFMLSFVRVTTLHMIPGTWCQHMHADSFEMLMFSF